MSIDVTPVWTTTDVQNGNMTVGFDAAVDDTWLQAVGSVEAAWSPETLGQTWGIVSFTEGLIFIPSVAEDTDVTSLRSYILELIDAANREYEHLLQERQRSRYGGREGRGATPRR